MVIHSVNWKTITSDDVFYVFSFVLPYGKGETHIPPMQHIEYPLARAAKTRSVAEGILPTASRRTVLVAAAVTTDILRSAGPDLMVFFHRDSAEQEERR